MSDDISFSILSDPAREELKKTRLEVDKATKNLLRSAGKMLAARARAAAPVYAGPRRDVPKGRLRKSIKTSRLKPDARDGYSMTVTPQGWPAHGYAAKIEAERPFMAPAHAEMSRSITALADAAWEKAIKQVRG